MRRDQLAHILRAACEVTRDGDILVVGSQSVLGSFSEDRLPPSAVMSIEADVIFLRATGREQADAVNGAIGEGSMFHATHGVYAEGVEREVAILPEGWRSRLVSWHLESSRPARPRFLERHDLAASKLARGESKDLEFVRALVAAGLLNPQTVLERTQLLVTDARHQTAAVSRAHAFVRMSEPTD